MIRLIGSSSTDGDEGASRFASDRSNRLFGERGLGRIVVAQACDSNWNTSDFHPSNSLLFSPFRDCDRSLFYDRRYNAVITASSPIVLRHACGAMGSVVLIYKVRRP